MKKLYLSNGFSPNMLAEFPATVEMEPLSTEAAALLAGDAESVVGHADTAAVFADELKVPVAFNRATVQLDRGDQLIVGQYLGPRLPEGAHELPIGATIKWLLATIR